MPHAGVLVLMMLVSPAADPPATGVSSLSDSDIHLALQCASAAALATSAAQYFPDDRQKRARFALTELTRMSGDVVPTETGLRAALHSVQGLLQSGHSPKAGSPSRDLFVGQSSALCFAASTRPSAPIQ